MVMPTVVTKKVIELILAEKSAYANSNVMAAEASENNGKIFNPPYCAVYSDFDEKAEIMSSGSGFSIPVGVYVICTSAKYETVEEAFAEAVAMAVNVLKKVAGGYTLPNRESIDEFVHLQIQDYPLLVKEKTASKSSVIAQLRYSLIEL